MDGRAFIAGLGGRARRRTLTLRGPMTGTRVRMPDDDMRTPGWLHALCVARAAQHGDEVLQISTPTGQAVAFVLSTVATAAMPPEKDGP